MTMSIEFVRFVMKDCVKVILRVAPERSDLAYYTFCNINIDTVLARE